MNQGDMLITVCAVCCAFYASRVHLMHPSTHRWAAIATQLLGAMGSLLIMYAATSGVAALFLYPPAIAMAAHILVTAPEWQCGPPNKTLVRQPARF